MKLDNIIMQHEEGVTIIKLNRPQELNTINYALLSDFVKALETAADDTATKAVIVTGEVKAFWKGNLRWNKGV